ncbi:MAG: hypothetical protein R3A79_05700 [Nannocystaceae bacterium]
MSLPQEPRERLLASLRRVDPAAWRAQVGAVLRAYGEVTSAAEALGIRASTLAAWVEQDRALRSALADAG